MRLPPPRLPDTLSDPLDQHIGEASPPDRSGPQVAVALGYDGRDLPKVLASGKGDLAERIIALALEQGVRVRKDADLAELLSAVDIDCEIPLEAIYAVAEILAYVYRANAEPAPGP